MDFKKLNEQLNKFLEGDVVSFADFQRRKNAERRKERSDAFLAQHGAEMQKEIDKFKQNTLMVEIEKIKVLSCEGPIKNPHFESGEEFSYEHFQEELYARDYMNQIMEKVDKCDFEVYLKASDGDEQTLRMRATIGEGRNECDIFTRLEIKLRNVEKDVMIINDPVKYNENYYKSLVKEYGIQAPVKEDPMDKPYIKDYSNNGTKTSQDVEVGDILECNWGATMSLVDYYKVIERKKSTIKLASLKTQNISGDGWAGTCIPTEETIRDQYVDGKLFRIGYKYDNKVVCSVNGHSVYYWDGKPGSFDRND